MLSQSDIDYLIETLDSAIKSRDWELVEEVRDYLLEFQDTPTSDEDE
jgi:sulfur relay (sulfurtransferase) DsrC/TusE family protein